MHRHEPRSEGIIATRGTVRARTAEPCAGRRDPEMCEALRELMKDEIQQERQEAADIALIAVIRNVMKSFGVDATKAMDSMGISPADQLRYAARL